MSAVAQQPVSIAIEADQKDFQVTILLSAYCTALYSDLSFTSKSSRGYYLYNYNLTLVIHFFSLVIQVWRLHINLRH